VKFRVRPVPRLAGSAEVPGDKSVSHRAALLGALADGATEIHGYLEAEDCLRTITAVQAMGAAVTRKGPGHYRIDGAGRHGLREPGDVIDCGNSGTAARLLLGVLAGQPFWVMLTGDESLRGRPMGRVAEPLRRMGAAIVGRSGGSKLPLAVRRAMLPPPAPRLWTSIIGKGKGRSAISPSVVNVGFSSSARHTSAEVPPTSMEIQRVKPA